MLGLIEKKNKTAVLIIANSGTKSSKTPGFIAPCGLRVGSVWVVSGLRVGCQWAPLVSDMAVYHVITIRLECLN